MQRAFLCNLITDKLLHQVKNGKKTYALLLRGWPFCAAFGSAKEPGKRLHGKTPKPDPLTMKVKTATLQVFNAYYAITEILQVNELRTDEQRGVIAKASE